MTYSQWYHDYLRLYKRDLSDKTLEGYTRLHHLIEPIVGAQPLEAITPDLLQAAIIAVTNQAGSRQAQLAYTLLHAVLRRAVRSGHIERNPADAIDRPDHQRRDGRAITAADWPILAPIIATDAAFALACHAGLRRGELLGLRRGDIDLDNGMLRIERQRVRVGGQLVTTTPKSSAGIRAVPIAPDLAPILRDATRYMLPSAYVVTCAPETLNRRWVRAQRAAGIVQPYRLHDLRHTYATRLTLAGCNLRVLQYIIGHADYQLTVQTYTHVTAATAQIELARLYQSLH